MRLHKQGEVSLWSGGSPGRFGLPEKALSLWENGTVVGGEQGSADRNEPVA